MSVRSPAAIALLAIVAPCAAVAAPVVSDPNFNLTPTSAVGSYYGIAAWGANGAPGGNQTYAGNIGFDSNNEWNNGTPGNGQTKVGFINNSTVATPGYISQVISGFTVGDSYTISVLVNGRLATGTAGLQISVSPPPVVVTSTSALALTPPAVVYSAAVPAVDPTTVQATQFQQVTSSAFTATSSSLDVTLTNSGVQGSTVLLSGFALADVTSVPEPVSLALLGTGLLGLAAVRPRR